VDWNNSEERKTYMRKYNAEHKEELKIKNKKYRDEHKKEAYARNLEWREKNPGKTREQSKRYYTKYTEKKNQSNRENTAKLKKEVLTHYGNGELKCVLCGFDNSYSLTIDHINGNGNNHRKQLGGGGMKVYLWLKRNNYPESFRTLCANCQLIEYAKKRREILTETPGMPGDNQLPQGGTP